MKSEPLWAKKTTQNVLFNIQSMKNISHFTPFGDYFRIHVENVKLISSTFLFLNNLNFFNIVASRISTVYDQEIRIGLGFVHIYVLMNII